MSDSNTERRAHARHAKSFELHTTPGSPGESARMITSNLSMGGVYCTSSKAFEEMTRLAVRMLLPSPDGGAVEPMDVEAVVVRQREVDRAGGRPQWELALFFTRMDRAQRERLARLLSAEE